MTVPPWAPVVSRLPDGQWQAALLVGDPLPSEEAANKLARFVCGHADRRLRDVAAQIDATSATEAAAAVPAPAFSSPA